jgi:hypothetical protein
MQTTYELCFEETYFEYFESCDFSRENTNIDVSMFMFDLRMINMSSELQISKSTIGFTGFVYQCRSIFRKHKGHDLAYDVKIMTSQQRLSRIVTSTFL